MRPLRAGVSRRGAGLETAVGVGAVRAGTGAGWAACLFEPWRECSDTVRTPPVDTDGGAGGAGGAGLPAGAARGDGCASGGDGGAVGSGVGAGAVGAVVASEAGGG